MKNLILILLALVICSPSFADEYNQLAQDIILSTANDRPYEEMYALACAIRNKSHMRGRGVGLASLDYITAEQRALVEKAWAESEHGEDPTLGSNGWVKQPETGNFIRPAGGFHETKNDKSLEPWMAGKYKTVQIGRFQFYKAPETAHKRLGYDARKEPLAGV